MISFPEVRKRGDQPGWQIAGLIALAALIGLAIAFALPVAFLVLAVSIVLLATRHVERLSVLMFWTVPYMVVNIPTGGFTLKLPEVVAYLFATAYAARVLIHREPIRWPPPTVQVLIYLGVLALSAAFSPPVPIPYSGDHGPLDRNSTDLRSISLIIWLMMSWLTVIALYNVVGSKPALYRQCIRTFILSSGIASLIGIVMYVMTLAGISVSAFGANGMLVFNNAGAYLRLAGVAYEPMFLGFFLATTIPVTIAVRHFLPEWIPRPLVTASLTVQVIAMILTLSGGGLFALMVDMILFAVLTKTWRQSRRVVTLIGAGVVVLAILGVVAYFAIPTISYIANVTAAKWINGTDPMRQAEANVGYAILSAHPILGVGPGMDNFYFPRYYEQLIAFNSGPGMEINNLYITVAAETGMIGILAFGWLGITGIEALFAALRRYGPENRPVLTALSCSLVGCALQYLSLNPLFLIYFTALIGIAVAGTRVASSEIETPTTVRTAV